MLKLALLFSCISGYVLLHKHLWRVPYAVAPASSVGLLTCVLFMADFAGVLELAAYALYAIGLGGFFYCLYQGWAGRIDLFRREAMLPAVALAVLFVGLYQLNRSGGFHEWDEFSHWGSIIKAIYGANTFHFEVNPLYFQDYPPGTALFSYFVLKLLGYSEGNAYFSYSLILLAFSLPVLGLAMRRGWAWALVYGTLIFVLVARLGHGWSSVLIDHILSVIFGGTIAGYFLLRRENSPLWSLSFMLVALVLAKHAGQSLALLVVALCAMDLLLSELVHDAPPRLRGPAAGRLRQIAFSSAGLLLPPLFVGWIWKYYVAQSNLAEGFGRFALSGLLARSSQCCTSERDLGIVTRYVDQALGVQTYEQAAPGNLLSVVASHLGSRLPDVLTVQSFSPALLFVLCVSAGLAAAFLAHFANERVRFSAATMILAAGALSFSLTQLLFYLYAFSEYEALSLASFNRFQRTYYLGWALAAMAIFAARKVAAKGKTSRLGWAAAIAFAVLLLALSGQTLRQVRHGAPGMNELRASIRQWALPLLPGIPESAPVYIVWQGSNGFEFWMIHHETLPRRTNRDCYSLGPPHFKGDIWSCPHSEKEVAALWAGYEYLAVGHGLMNLKATYPALLANVPPGVDRGLLRIEKHGGGKGISLVLAAGG